MLTILEYFSQSEKISSIDEYVFNKTISSIDEYLLSKTQHPKTYDIENPHDFGCLVEAYHDAWDMLYDKFNDVLIEPDNGDPGLFFITKDDAKENIKPKDMVRIYEVPEKYDTLKKFSEFEEEYIHGEITLEDLKQIRLEDL